MLTERQATESTRVGLGHPETDGAGTPLHMAGVGDINAARGNRWLFVVGGK